MAVDEALARRYVDHGGIGDRYFLGLHRIEQHLEGNELKAYRHRLKKIDRDTAKEEARVIATYGAGFRRSWAAADIYSLAASATRTDPPRGIEPERWSPLGSVLGQASPAHHRQQSRCGPSEEVSRSKSRSHMRARVRGRWGETSPWLTAVRPARERRACGPRTPRRQRDSRRAVRPKPTAYRS